MEDENRPDGAAEPAGEAMPWAAPPTHKERTGVERAVERLLDELAPERVVSRATRLPAPVERLRTPRGCILQAAAAAVSVSWFPDGASDTAFGELQIIAWQGVVSRPGSAHRAPGGAAIARELMLRPVEGGPDGWLWRATDGTVYDTSALAARCLALLEEQIGATGDDAG